MGDAGRIGPYVLRGELGRGAMARVWRAWDPNLEREVAIKEPLFDPSLPEAVLSEMGRRFVAEGRAAARLSHPNVVAIYAADVWEGRPAIVMELVEGPTLSGLLRRGPVPAAQAIAILDQLLDAVGYAHDRGIVHRDIKPDNVFVTHDGTVKLADFGIARVDAGAATRATVAGSVLGTPGYMSPEQARGEGADARSDLFSVGVVAHEMLSGSNPFGSGEPTALLYRIVYEPAPELPSSACAGLPADLRPAIMAALAKDPADRPQTAEAFKAMLHGEAAAPAAPQTAVRAPVDSRPAVSQSDVGNSPARRTVPSWLPYAIVGGCCVVALVVVLMSANSGGGTGLGSLPEVETSIPVKQEEEAATEESFYVAVNDGHVAIYEGGAAKPYEVSDVDVSELGEDSANMLDDHIEAASIQEAQAIVENLRSEERANKEARYSIIGNLINGGHMGMGYDGMLYYADPLDGTDWNTQSIVRCAPDGSDKATIYRAPSSTINLYHISVIGSRVVFNQVMESGSTVVVVSSDGSRALTLDSCDSWSLCQVENNRVYYLKGGRIWSCSLEGASKTSHAEVGTATLWRIWTGRLITFAEKGGDAVYVSELDGSVSKAIYRASGGATIKNAFPVDDQRVLVWERSSSGGDGRVVLVDCAHGTETQIWADAGGMQRMCASADDAFVTTRQGDGTYRIAGVGFDGTPGSLDVIVPERGETRYTSFLHGRIYYAVIDADAGNACSIHSVSPTGTDFRLIAN